MKEAQSLGVWAETLAKLANTKSSLPSILVVHHYSFIDVDSTSIFYIIFDGKKTSALHVSDDLGGNGYPCYVRSSEDGNTQAPWQINPITPPFSFTPATKSRHSL
jgi:hypothetical protein